MKKRVSGSNGQIRIIGGRWRGRKLPVMNADGLRPTGDRLRETLFNWLQYDIHGARVLDLFAGAGSLGFEAASRGAGSVTLVEQNAATSRKLRENAEFLQADNIDVICADAFSYIRDVEQPFDLIFLDPPFGKGLLDKIWHELQKTQAISQNTILYMESDIASICPEIKAPWFIAKQSKAGQVQACLVKSGQSRDNDANSV